jgi:MFS family permease
VGYSVVLANRKFDSLLIGQVVSLFGDVMLGAALSWFVFALTGTATSVSYLSIAIVVPNLLFSLVAGVIVDRWNRRRIMMASDLVRCFALLLIPVMYHAGGLTLSLLYMVVFVVGSASAFFLPARTAIIPQIFKDKDQLASANSIMNGMFEATRLIGFGISGVFIILFTAVGAAAFNSMTYIVSALAIFIMGPMTTQLHGKRGNQNAPNRFRRDLLEGLTYVWKNFVIRIVLVSSMLANFFISIGYGFTVVYAREALSTNAVGYGILLAANALGTVSGSFIVGKVNFRKHLGMTLILSSIVMGAAIIGLSPQKQLAVAVPLIAIFGFSLAIYNVNYVNMLQATVPNEILGRVMSLDQVLSFAILPLSFAIGGPLVDFIGIRTAYLLSGGVVLLIAAATFISQKFRKYSY